MSQRRTGGRLGAITLLLGAVALLSGGCVSVSTAPTPGASPSSDAASSTPPDAQLSPAPARTSRPCTPGDTRPRCQTAGQPTGSPGAPPSEPPTAPPTQTPTASPTATPRATATTTGTASDGPITVAPTTIFFGSVDAGNTSPTLAAVVTNTGGAPFGPLTMFGGAPSSAQFGASQNCQGTTLAPAASCQVGYTFTPSGPGSFSGSSSFTISPTTSQTDGFDFTIALSGCGGACP